MPLQKCKTNGKSGWKWGGQGTCYGGPEGKKKAIRQGVAIEGPEKFQRMAGVIEFTDDVIEVVAESMKEEGYSLGAIVVTCATLKSIADEKAGYPPHCKPGYVEMNGKCVLAKDPGPEPSVSRKMAGAEINNLPDSEFAYIEPGGKKDSEGKTTPRSLRHLPIPDAAHVRNALARLPQTNIPAAAKKSALKKIKSKAKKLGIEVSE